jgi:opacity protein-like surface antigen
MMRVSFGVAAASIVLLLPTVALAQSGDDGDCPPGGWFCEEAEPAQVEPGFAEPPPEAGPEEVKQSPPVVVYRPEAGSGSRRIIIVDQPDGEPRPAKRRRPPREWGFNLRLESAIMGDDPKRADDSGMGGLGFSFRYRPIPHFAFDAGLDFLGGVDWEGQRRRETALMLNAMIFFNPKDKLQLYTLGGLGFSGARVTKVREAGDTTGMPGEEHEEDYSYFGGQLGIGLEWRIARKTALNLDLVGFIRGRTDEKARTDPEFTDDETGRRTNTSGGGLARIGITFYW